MSRNHVAEHARRGHVRRARGASTLVCVNGVERADIEAIIAGVFDANRKLDEILDYIYDDDDGEEEETDSA